LRIGKRNTWICVVIAAVLFVPGLGSCTTTSDNAEPVDEWTILIYCGADNENEIATDFSIDQCVKALRENDNEQVTIIVLLDRHSTDGTWIYELDPEESNGRKTVATWHERNTSDPAVLKEFVIFGMDNYPAEKTMLIIKNGKAWCGVCPDETDGGFIMPMDGVAMALEESQDEVCRSIDLLALDGDNMASIEGAYELRNAVPYLIASQQDVPIDGLPYYLMVTDLVNDPGISAVELAEEIVVDYVLYYNNTIGKKNVYDHLLRNSQMMYATIAAFDMSGMQEVGDAFGDIVSYMVETEDWIPSNRYNISPSRDFALIGKGGDQAGYEWLPDVYTFFMSLSDLADDDDLDVLVDAFQDAFNDMVIRMEQCQVLDRSGNSVPHGLNIWFPPTWTQWDALDSWSRTRTYLYDGSQIPVPSEYYCIDCPYDYNDCGLDLVQDSDWMEFLEIYYQSQYLIHGRA